MRAFTLVELIVVLVIISIGAAIAVPMMSQDAVRVPAAARMVGSDIGYARTIATSHQTQVQITFQTTGTQVTGYEIRSRDSAGAFNFVNRPADLTPMRVIFGPTQTSNPYGTCLVGSVALNTTPRTDFTVLSFDSRGQPSFSTDGTTFTVLPTDARISITDLDGQLVATISIQPITGVVRVE